VVRLLLQEQGVQTASELYFQIEVSIRKGTVEMYVMRCDEVGSRPGGTTSNATRNFITTRNWIVKGIQSTKFKVLRNQTLLIHNVDLIMM